MRYRGRFAVASAAYRRAVGLDSTFALAHYRLALAILWGNQPGAETALHDSLAQNMPQVLPCLDT